METINIANLVVDLKKADTWILLIIVALFGMLGGFAHKLTSATDDETSLARYLVVGAVASLAVLFIFAPSDPVRLIALSLASGYGGKAILDALEAKVKVALAEAKTEKAKEEGQKAVNIAKNAIDQAQKLYQINAGFEKELTKTKSDALSFMQKPPETVADDLKELQVKLKDIEGSFSK